MAVRLLCAAMMVAWGGSVGVRVAQGPTFDCARAQGEVETLICEDADLGALDRKLDQVYKAATAKAEGQMLATLRAEQRGWVKGRNECWKAGTANPVFLTASWTAEKELIPKARRDPSCLDREDLEIVAGGADDAPALPATPENLSAVIAGKLFIRQKPGPENSLGLAKFIFPNSDGRHLWARPRPRRRARPGIPVSGPAVE